MMFSTLHEHERGVIGACLLYQDQLEHVLNFTVASDFDDPRHRNIWHAIELVRADGERLGYDTIRDKMIERGTWDSKSSGSHLLDIIAFSPEGGPPVFTHTFAKHNAEVIRGRALSREFQGACSEGAERAGEIPLVKAQHVQESMQQIDNDVFAGIKAKISPTQTGPVSFKDILAHMATMKVPDGIKTGFFDIDDLTPNGGLSPGWLVVFAARPNVGKSTLALNVLWNAWTMDRKASAYISLEMSRTELASRLLTITAEKEIEEHVPIDLIESPGNLVAVVRAIEKAASRGANLIVIDHLQLMSYDGPGTPKRTENRVQELSQITRDLKLLAREYGIVIVAISQLNRAVENREGKRPQLSDLRDSGSIEQDADLVLLLHRPGLYSREEDPTLCAVAIAKNRHGPTGRANLNFNAHSGRFSNRIEMKETTL